jgi:hypothetical protein
MLQAELGKLTQNWVKDRGQGRVATQDLQSEIDSLIDKWTATAIQRPPSPPIGTPIKPRSLASPAQLAASLVGLSADTVGMGAAGATQRKKMESFVDVGGGRYQTPLSVAHLVDEAAVDPAIEQLDPAWRAAAAAKERQRQAAAAATRLEEQRREEERAMDEEEEALLLLADHLERRGLREVWAEPDGNSLYEAVAQLLFAHPELRARAAAGGVVFRPEEEEVDGVTLLRLPG